MPFNPTLRKSFLILYILFFTINAEAQTVTVEMGYGSGVFTAGDTIHIYAKEENLTEAFDHWSGDTLWLEDPSEWHSKVVVPNRDIQLKANYIQIPKDAQLQFERLQGYDTIKPVLYYFPSDPKKTKALVWLFHGTGGNFQTLPSQVDGYLNIKRLIANGYAVAISECDEATYRNDFSGDGNIRWNYNLINGTNPDMLNHIMFMEYFKAKGWMRPGLPVFGWGFSAGGVFALTNGPLMKFNKGVSFCGIGGKAVGDLSTMPSMWSLGSNDNHPDVGKEGNDTARINYEKMTDRGVCAFLYTLTPSPFYPEYFRRIKGIDSTLSVGIYNEMKFAGAINNKNMMALFPDELKIKVLANPAQYPSISSLNTDQIEELEKMMIIMNAGHIFHSHYTGKVIQFFEEECDGLSTENSDLKNQQDPLLFPNPCYDHLTLTSSEMAGKEVCLRIYSIQGNIDIEKHFSSFPKTLLMDIYELHSGYKIISLQDNLGYVQKGSFIKNE